MSLNRVTIIGHLGQEPELRYLANGQAVGRFSVATDEPYTDKEGKRQRTEIVASRVQFLGTPPTDAKGATAVEEPVPPADSEVPF